MESKVVFMRSLWLPLGVVDDFKLLHPVLYYTCLQCPSTHLCGK